MVKGGWWRAYRCGFINSEQWNRGRRNGEEGVLVIPSNMVFACICSVQSRKLETDWSDSDRQRAWCLLLWWNVFNFNGKIKKKCHHKKNTDNNLI